MLTLTINGSAHEVDVPADMPLLWVLRDVVGLTGTKFGCGISACGACTVHLDGQPIRSCITPVAAGAGKQITTLEGIGDTPAGKRAQQAWMDLEGLPFGYGLSGRTVWASALLRRNSPPRDANTDTALAKGFEVGMAKVQLDVVPPDDSLYINPLLDDQETGASSSVRGFYLPLRRAGAAERSMLVAAAAQQWSVDPSSCRTDRGVVTHSESERKLSYGALAARAAKLPTPTEVVLKDRK